MTFPKLFRKEVEDEFAQENFTRIQDYFRGSPLERCEFKFFELVVPAAVTGFTYPHGLSFIPKDIITMHNSTNATVTFNYNMFTSRFINLDSSGVTTLRFLAGRYENV